MAASAAFAALIGFFSVRRSGHLFRDAHLRFPDAALHDRAEGDRPHRRRRRHDRPEAARRARRSRSPTTTSRSRWWRPRSTSSTAWSTRPSATRCARCAPMRGACSTSASTCARTSSPPSSSPAPLPGSPAALFALSSGNVFPGWLNWTASATPIVMAVLGGVHTFLGPALGARGVRGAEVLISGKHRVLAARDGHHHPDRWCC